MKKVFQRTLSLLIATLLASTMCVSSIIVTSASSSGQLSYSFSNSQIGNAQGTISLSAEKGTYSVYWADNSKILDEFEPLGTLSFSSTTTKSITLPANTAIPANATKVVAINNGSSSSTNTIYFINNVGWSSVYCHAYNSNDTSDRNASWPGDKMTYVGQNADGYSVYSIELKSNWNEFQFDNGNSGNKNQTVDITKGFNNAYIISDPSSSGKYNTNNVSFSTSNLKNSTLKTSSLKTATNTSTIYFINNVNWSKVYCHAYNASNTSDRNASWPGVLMDYVGKNADGYGVYSIELNSNWNEFQFDNGSGGNRNQTVDITRGSNNAYIVSNPSTSGQFSTNNITYNQSETPETTTPTNPSLTSTIYFINNVNWSSVYCHAYNATNQSDRNASWPGAKMTYVGKNDDGYGVYSIELNSNWNEFQFDNGSSGNRNQTVDITKGSKNAYIVNNTSTSGKFSTDNVSYSVTPITTDPINTQPTATQQNTSAPIVTQPATQQKTEPTVDEQTDFEGAYAVFNIPASKRSANKLIYSFASYSDIQLDSEKSAYPYSYTNFKNALELANKFDTDFIITSGDNVNNKSSSKQATEWNDFEKIIADSSYCNPVYEAIGNHELWGGLSSGAKMFIKNSGLDSNSETISKGKAYFEKTINGDHFIFMALENGFHAETCDEFTNEQLTWVENLLKKYSGDGHNIFLIEHSPIKHFGAGDKTDSPYYGGLMTESYPATTKFKSLLTKYKDIIFLSGHTHIELAQQLNYSDNNGTSCQTIHNSSVGGSRKIVNNALNYNYSSTQSEGYIVSVYTDRIVFTGVNITSGKFLPLSTYNVKTSANMIGVTPVYETNIIGDVNSDGVVNILDATKIQLYLAGKLDKTEITYKNADTDMSLIVNVSDATFIQEYCAKIQKSLPVPYNEITEYVNYSTFNTKAKAMLNSNYTYSSYDQYLALKKIYNSSSKDALPHKATYLNYAESVYNELDEFIGKQTNPTVPETGKNITVYFENNKNWSDVYAYVWTGSNNLSSWCGTKMTYVGKSKNGYNVYSITFDYSLYSNIIFNNGSSQTVDIALDGTNNVAFSLSSNNGKYDVTKSNLSNIM